MIFGLASDAMPEGWVPLEAVCVVKCLDEDGETALLVRTTEGLRVWDATGMLVLGLDVQRDRGREMFVSESDDEDGDGDRD